MKPPIPPKILSVEVVPTRPTEADKAAIAHLSTQGKKALPQITYVVKVRLKEVPPATSHGWALYLKDFRIPKYWEYKHGIYFKVFDGQFFEDHEGAALRFSSNGTDFTDTRMKFTAGKALKGTEPERLPPQEEVLHD